MMNMGGQAGVKGKDNATAGCSTTLWTAEEGGKSIGLASKSGFWFSRGGVLGGELSSRVVIGLHEYWSSSSSR